MTEENGGAQFSIALPSQQVRQRAHRYMLDWVFSIGPNSMAEVGDLELEHHNLDIALVGPSLPEGDRLVIVREVSKRDVANAVVLVSLNGVTNDTRSHLINTNRATQEATHSVRSGLKRRETVAYSRRRIAKSSSQTIYEIGSNTLIVEQALKAGAVGVLSTSCSLKEVVVEALRRIAARRG